MAGAEGGPAKRGTIRVLGELIEADPALQGHPERSAWAKDRWISGMSYLGRRISGNRTTVYWLRAPIVFGSLLVPILATGAASSSSTQFWRWTTVAVSLVVALCTAIDQVVRPAARWRVVRETRGALESHGWAFLQREGRYAGHDDDTAFGLFFEAVEGAWEAYEQAYLSQVAHSQEAPGPGRRDTNAQSAGGG